MNTRELTCIALFAAVLCVAAPFSLPLGVIPISLGTLFIYIIGAVLPVKCAVSTVLVYIALGMVGLPVFSGFTGGVSVLLYVTGGYIVGYLPCAFVTAFMIKKAGNKKWFYPVAMICGTFFLYLLGTLWFVFSAKVGFSYAVSVCIVPFLIGDCLKVIAASVISVALKKRLSIFLEKR